MKINRYVILILFIILSSCKSKKVIIQDDTLFASDKDTINNENMPNNNLPISSTIDVIDQRKILVSTKMGVHPDELQNETLYLYIADWLDTPYLWGGDTKNGIDCSAFTQQLYSNVYKKSIPRTSIEQFSSSKIQLFRGKKALQEGDLIFFRINRSRLVSHVGVYLKNNKFVASGGSGGVQIEDLNSPYWTRVFASFGRVK